jgi:putative transposase
MTEPKPKHAKRVKPDPELVKLADSLLTNYKKPEDLIGENGLLKQLTKMLVERALETDMTEHWVPIALKSA